MASETQPSGVRLQDTKPQEDGAALRMYENSTKLEYLRNVDLPENGFSVATRRSAGTFSFSLGLSAGDWVVEWWDGVRELRSATTTASKTISGAYANASPKVVKVFPVSSLEYFTSLTFGAASVSAIDVSRLSQLTDLSIGNNSVGGTFDVSHMTSLQYFTLNSSEVEKIILPEDPSSVLGINVSSASNLTEIVNFEKCVDLGTAYMQSSGLTRLDFTGWNGNLDIGYFSDMLSLTEVISLGDAMSNSGYAYITLYNCTSLTSIDVAGLSGGFVLDLAMCALTEIRGVGASNDTDYSSSYLGFQISGNNLDAAALDQFYTDLASGTGGINVYGNPGVSGHDPTIATGKGYTVYG